jgi:hypothetical protein
MTDTPQKAAVTTGGKSTSTDSTRTLFPTPQRQQPRHPRASSPSVAPSSLSPPARQARVRRALAVPKQASRPAWSWAWWLWQGSSEEFSSLCGTRSGRLPRRSTRELPPSTSSLERPRPRAIRPLPTRDSIPRLCSGGKATAASPTTRTTRGEFFRYDRDKCLVEQC